MVEWHCLSRRVGAAPGSDEMKHTPKDGDTRRESRRAEGGARPWCLAAILTLALGLRLAYVGGLPADAPLASVDAKGYYALAVNLLQHGVFSLRTAPPLVPDGIRTPLYPAWIAGILLLSRHPDRAIPVAQALLDTATMALAYGLAVRLTNRRRAIVVACLYALNPVSFLFIGEALTEIVEAFLLTLTCLLFVAALQAQQRQVALLAAAGFTSALCVLCKPNMVLLPLILGVGLILQRRSVLLPVWKEAGLMLGVAILAVSPWLVRNGLVFGRPFLSLAFEDNLIHVSAVATVLEAQAEQVAPWTPRWEETYLTQIVAPARDRYGWEAGADPSTAREAANRLHQLAAVAKSVIRRHPGAFLAAHLKGVLRSFVPSLQRYWFAYLTRTAWPEREGLRSALTQAWRMGGQGDLGGGFRWLAAWWGGQPALAQGLWVASVVLSGLGYGLVLAGLWSLRIQPGLLAAFGLMLLYLVLLPGPIAYLRFWTPGVSLACALMGCASVPRRGHERASLPREVGSYGWSTVGSTVHNAGKDPL